MTTIDIRGKFPAWRDGVTEGRWDTMLNALKAAGLNYQTQAVPLPPIVLPDGEAIEVKDRMALVRGRTGKDPHRRFIDIVSSDYRAIQHTQFGHMMDRFAQASDKPLIMIGASGQYDTRVVVGFDFGEFPVGGWDTELTKSIFYAWNSNDGGTSLGGMMSQVRMSCLNMMPMTWKTAAIRFKIKHSGEALMQAEQWVTYLGKVQTSVVAQREQMNRLAEIRVAQQQIGEYISQVYPLPKNSIVEQYKDAPEQAALPDQVTRNRAALAAMIERTERYRIAAVESYDKLSDEFPHIGGTAWALYNAVAECETWRPNGRGNGSRLESMLFGARREVGERAFELALALG